MFPKFEKKYSDEEIYEIIFDIDGKLKEKKEKDEFAKLEKKEEDNNDEKPKEVKVKQFLGNLDS